MAITRYRDVVLVAEATERGPDGRAGRMRVSVYDSPVGQSEHAVDAAVPGDVWTMAGMLDRGTLAGDLAAQVRLGRMLANLLLPRAIREMLRRSLDRITDDEGLRLRLRLDDELGDLPWEYLYVQPAGDAVTSLGFLALNPRISITRHEALPVPGDWYEAPGRRRVVVAMASPEPYDRYPRLHNLPREQELLRAALGRVPGVEVEFIPDLAGREPDDIPSATLGDLTGAFTRRADVLHFAGHGEVVAGGRGAPRSQVILGDDRNQALIVDAGRLAEVLRGRGVRLVVLGACEAGRQAGRNIWNGVATALLGVEIPAVVAMQSAIRDDLAAEFAGAFYQALVAGLTVDEAVAGGRIAMHIGTTDDAVTDWGVPVLYLRSPGGAVFNPVSDDAARTAATEASNAILVEQSVRIVGPTGRLIGAVIDNLAAQAGPEGLRLEIAQRVAERVEGLVVGADVFELGPDGDIRIRQEADEVVGDMVGFRAGADRADRVTTGAAQRLEEALGVSHPA